MRPTDARRKPVVGDIRPLLYAASSVYSRLSRRTLGVLGTCNECRCRILEFCDSGTEAASSMDEAGGEEWRGWAGFELGVRRSGSGE